MRGKPRATNVATSRKLNTTLVLNHFAKKFLAASINVYALRCLHEESSLSTLVRMPELESKDATDELSDLKLSLSSDKADDPAAEDKVELLVTCELRFRFLGGSGGGYSSTFLLQMIQK